MTPDASHVPGRYSSEIYPHERGSNPGKSDRKSGACGTAHFPTYHCHHAAHRTASERLDTFTSMCMRHAAVLATPYSALQKLLRSVFGLPFCSMASKAGPSPVRVAPGLRTWTRATERDRPSNWPSRGQIAHITQWQRAAPSCVAPRCRLTAVPNATRPLACQHARCCSHSAALDPGKVTEVPPWHSVASATSCRVARMTRRQSSRHSEKGYAP